MMKHLPSPVGAQQREDNTIKCFERKKKKFSYKMIALDLDKTLLNKQNEISKTSIDYLRYLHDRGIIICIATGRSISSSLKIIQKLGLEYPLLYEGTLPKGENQRHYLKGFPLICNNGALGLSIERHHHAHTHEKDDEINKELATQSLLFHHPVPMDVTMKTIALGKSIGCVTNYYIENDIYTQPTHDWHYKAVQRDSDINGVQYTFCDDSNDGNYNEAIRRGLPSKLIIMCEKNNVDGVFSQISNELNGSTPPASKNKKKEQQLQGRQERAKIMKGSSHIEILQKGICKGTALEKMCHIVGIDTEECISFGDAHNDIEFIKVSGLGIAMKNGIDYLKSIADDITEYSNDEDGVVRAIQNFEQAGMLAFTK